MNLVVCIQSIEVPGEHGKTNQITPTYLGCSKKQRWDPLYFTLPTTIKSKHYMTNLEILDGNVHLEEWWQSAPEWRCLQWSDLRSPQRSQRGRYLHQLIEERLQILHRVRTRGCIVLNMYKYTWVHRRCINMNTTVLCIHTINTFRTENIHIYFH